MPIRLTPNEEAQTLQTIDMFEVIAQADPMDHQALEILKEAYSKMGRRSDVLRTSKRIAHAHVQSGQLSSAILEYESILQVSPNDPEVKSALADIENRANQVAVPPSAPEPEVPAKNAVDVPEAASPSAPDALAEIDDGRLAMRKAFVEGKHISESDFDLCWKTPNRHEPPKQVIEPFIQVLADNRVLALDKSLKLLCEKSRLSFLPLEKYDVDIELARSFPREICQRWCVLPFDRMGKSVLVATANPFNKQAVAELESTNSDPSSKRRFLWYVASPGELLKILRKVFR